MSDQVTKIYELRTLGYGEISQELQDIAKRFQEIKKAKQEAGKIVGSSTAKQETEDVKKQKEALAALRVEEQKLKVDRQKLLLEGKALQLARQQEINQQKQLKQATDAAAGSYNSLYKEFKELYALVKAAPKDTGIDFRGQSLGFDQAVAKLKELAAAEQDFRRQFSRDSLLVGEYTSGIVQAFKQMGLDDLVGGQIQKANERLGMLDNEFKDLQTTLSQIRVTGQGSFEAIEKQLIDNRKEALALQQQVGNLEKEFRSAGDVGDRVSGALGRGFRDLKGQIAQYALTYLSFQALLTTGQQTLDTTVQLDSVDSALELVSGSTQELATNQEFLRQVTERLGLQYIESAKAFKNFFAASTLAGISAEDTRMIFEAAASSAARLKLSQEDTNSVLLAFSQIASKGKVQAEELRGQIGERVPGAFSIAAKAIGVTQQQLNKMMENGEVIASEFLPKFATELQKTFGGDTTQRVEGLQAGINRLKNQFTDLIRDNQAGLTAFFQVLVSVTGLLFGLLGYFPQLILLLGLYATGWAVMNKELVIAQARLFIVNAQLIASRIALGAVNVALALNAIAQRAYNAAILLFTGIQRGATTATVLFGNALRLLPLGLILTAIGLLLAAFRAFAASVTNTTDELRANALQSQLNAEIGKRVAQSTGEQVNRLQLLTKVAGDNTISLEGRKRALQDLINIAPDYLRGLTLENLRTEEGIGIINRYITALKQKAAVQAAEAIRGEKLQRDTQLQLLQFELERRVSTGEGVELEDLPEEAKDFVGEARKQFNFTASVTDLITGGSAAQEALARIQLERSKLTEEIDLTDKIIAERFAGTVAQTTTAATQNVEVNISALQDKLKGLNDSINNFKGSSADLQKLISDREATQKEIDRLLNGEKSSTKGSGRVKPTDSPEEKRRKLIEEVLKQQLADLRLSFLNKEITEEDYLQKVLDSNRQAYKEKLALIKGSSAEELAAIAELKASQKQLEIDTSNQIFDIREKALEDALSQRRREIEANLTAIEDDPLSSPLARAQARLDADRELLKLQEQFNKDMDALEGQYSRQSVEKAFERAEAIKTINRNLSRDQIQSLQTQLEQIQQDGRNAVARFQEQISAARLSLSGKTGRERRRAESELSKAESRGILAAEVESLNKQLPIYKVLVDAKVKTDEDYLLLAKDLSDKVRQLNDSTVSDVEQTAGRIRSLGDQLREGLRNLFNFEEGGLLDNLLGDAITQSYDLARGAMNAYYDAEIQRIEQSKEANLERLDLEKNQLLARAQSREEELAIDKQYQAKKEEEERRAGERIKKVRKAEAKVALASELANIAVAAAQNPLNGITLGAAGIAMYGILAGLAVGRYALRVNEINRAEFEYGGQVPTTTGGKITGPSHSAGGVPFNYEAEGGELAIVRTKNAGQGRYTISGTHTQIASALNKLGGGRDFFSGAKVQKFDFGGNLGETLEAPVFTPASSTAPGANDSIQQTFEILDTLKKQSEAIQAVSNRVDNIKVYQVTSEVEGALNLKSQRDKTQTL